MRPRNDSSIDRRDFMLSAAALTASLTIPLPPANAARDRVAPASVSIAVVDTRFDAALRAAGWLRADTYITMGSRPDAYGTWRSALRDAQFSEICGVTTFSDFELLRNCLARKGYRLTDTKTIQGRVTVVQWSLRGADS
jgi:hypothetical protein